MNTRAIETQDSFRRDIDLAVSRGDASLALSLLGKFWREYPGPATASYLLASFEELRPVWNPRVFQLIVLRSFTVEPVISLLQASAAVNGIDLRVEIGGFNAYAQELLDPHSSIYETAPDGVVLAVQTRDVVPQLWSEFADLSPAAIAQTVEEVLRSYRGWIETFRSRSRAHLIVHTLEIPEMPSQGILDAQVREGQCESIRSINRGLLQIAQETEGVYVLDYDALVARFGRGVWHDEGKWLSVRLPIAAHCLVHLAHEWLRYICPLAGKSCKVLVVDLDNTLWGGVAGEDGFEGIQIGPDYPGAAYQAVQRAMLDLYHRGVVLAVCSKNNPAEAMEILARHPGMLLKPQQFAALRINWNDKARNLREIAAELNVGVEALAFLDDNPVERQWVRSQVPEVSVIELPKDPMDYARALREACVFETLKLSAEDRERGKYYEEQKQRQDLKRGSSSLEDFYSSLQMEAEIGEVKPETIARIGQLTQKTNQFNLTTRRYTEQQIKAMSLDPTCRLYALRARDRFGDNGLVGLAITRQRRDQVEIDTFLMSCRVIGRTLETALLAVIVDDAHNAGARRLSGWFVPTPKNAPAREFYSRHGFTRTGENEQGSRWDLDLEHRTIQSPPWIRVRVCIKEAIS